MDIFSEIVSNINNPIELEKLYREQPEAFRSHFLKIYQENSDSLVLKVWKERLFYEEKIPEENLQLSLSSESTNELYLIILLCVIAGTFAKLPVIFNSIDSNFFYPRNISFSILPAIAVYFLVKKGWEKKHFLSVLLPISISLIFINCLPDSIRSDTLILSCMHIPFFLWSIVGIAYIGNDFKNISNRISYLKYNGETIIYTTIILIGGMVLTGLTWALFSLIKIKIERWYMEYVVVYGAVSAPIVATYIIEVFNKNRNRIAPIISKIFSPLFLVTLIGYLLTIIIKQKSPYTDRDFLIVFNGLLIVVLGITIFAISERKETSNKYINDYINISLVLATLSVDIIALSAIVYRLSSYGLTPNRIAVLGANVIIFINLTGIFYYYFNFMRNKNDFHNIENWVGKYLPVYTFWTGIVTFIFPFIFAFH